MNTVTALLEYLDLVCNFLEGVGGGAPHTTGEKVLNQAFKII